MGRPQSPDVHRQDVVHGIPVMGCFALRARGEDEVAMGTSIKECESKESKGIFWGRSQKCRLSRLFFRQTIIFPVDVGLMIWDVDLDGLWIVSVCKSNVFHCKRNSRSLSTKLVGEAAGEMGKVGRSMQGGTVMGVG